MSNVQRRSDRCPKHRSRIHQKIQEKDTEWTTLIDTLAADDPAAHDAESAEYDATAVAADGYLEQLLDAEATVSTRLRKLELLIAALSAAAAKLPKIDLPTFDGDVFKWRGFFWTIFCENIHNRGDLSGVTKLAYLRPLLKGSASAAIEGYNSRRSRISGRSRDSATTI